MKSSTVNPDHNPGIREQDIGLLKGFYIFKPVAHELASCSILMSKLVKETDIDIDLEFAMVFYARNPYIAPDE